jgi:hypothetical protein
MRIAFEFNRAGRFHRLAFRGRGLSFAYAFVFVFTALSPVAAFAADPNHIDFNFQIRPLLSDRCFRCHGPDAGSRKAKMRLDTLEGSRKKLEDDWAVIQPGDPAKSELVRRIYTADEDDVMPPPQSNLKLTSQEKDLLKQWIANGAEYKPHWAFIPVQAVQPPKPTEVGKIRNPIDAFVLAKLESEKLQPAPEASREILIRRLAFDLTGLPPTVTEIDSFLADTSTNAYERVVEQYLASPAYGERMTVDWLDLARYADTYGYQQDVDRDMSPWRDWVIRAFNDNLSYDNFILWQIAGDLLENATRDQKLATAFNRLHRQTNEGGSIDEEFRQEYLADRVNTVGTALLGVTVGCARCHDHKYDPILQRDYYSLTAFFNSIDESGTYSHFTRATPTPTMLLWPADKARQEAELKSKLAQAEKNLQRAASGADGAYQSWLQTNGQMRAVEPVARFAFDKILSITTTNNTTNYVSPDSVTTNMAKLEDDPVLVPGHNGQALQFSGDNQAVCKGLGDFRRTDEFSFSLWIKPTEHQYRAVVLHHSKAAMDSGSRGYELVLDQGRPSFGLIHFWPGNALLVRATQSLPTNEWSQITVTYDGSSRASGVKIYANDVRATTDTLRDNLSKDIVHRKEWDDLLVGKIDLTLAARFRDNGFKNGVIDDLQIFDVCLTGAEVERLGLRGQAQRDPALNASSSGDAKAPSSLRSASAVQDDLRQYFLTREYEPYRTAAAELKKLREQENKLINDVPEIMVMQELPQPRPAFLLKRGAYDAPGDPVERDTPASILPFPKDQPRDRLGLAHWLIDRNNPLTARVEVNRIWRMHFGRGLVTSEQDFGSQGKLPTHPQLLDWLAGWFVDNGWDLKALHRLIVSSATYRQSSQASRELVEHDPDNALLARGPKQRLPAEQIRDSALAASGLLNPAIGGPSVKPYQPAGLWEQSGTGAKYKQDTGDKLYRRSLYTFWKRTAPPPSMLTFDAVTREVCTANRETTTTPLQALVLLNDPQFVEAARVLGERLLKQHPDDCAARIRDAFRTLTGRLPDEQETATLQRLCDEQKAIYEKNPADAAKLLSTGESKWDQSLPRADFAATTMLVCAVMNLDDFVMKR